MINYHIVPTSPVNTLLVPKIVVPRCNKFTIHYHNDRKVIIFITNIVISVIVENAVCYLSLSYYDDNILTTYNGQATISVRRVFFRKLQRTSCPQ